jgi:hypothetical protein
VTISVYPPYGSGSNNPIYVQYAGAQLDAFGRLRVSEPLTLFDSQNRYAADNQFDTSTATGGTTTFLTNESTLAMTVTSASGSSVVRQTYRVFPYQPGKSLLMLATFVMDASINANLTQRVGYFNTENGVFFQKVDSQLSFVLRSYISGATSDARTVPQSQWNGDKLDGTGPSGYTLDASKAQILFMDFEWLGVGNVRCGFIINGQYIIAHTFQNANQITSVYMTTATLPVRYEIFTTGATSGSATMKQICSSVVSEGGYQQAVVESVASRPTVKTGIGSSYLPLVSIRLASDRLGAVIVPSRQLAVGVSNDFFSVALFKNATLTGESYNTTEFPSVDYDVAATAMSGGTIVTQEYMVGSPNRATPIAQAEAYNFDLQLGVSLAGVSDVYTLAVKMVTGTNGQAIGGIGFWDLTG